MRTWMSPLRLGGVLVGVLLGLALVAAACSSDDQAQQSAAQQAQAQQQAEQQDQPQATADPQPQADQSGQTAQAEQVQAADPPPEQQQQEQQQQQPAPAAQQEVQEAQEQPAQQEETDSAAAQEQQAVQQQGEQQQAEQQMMVEEAVPEGTRLITLFGDITEIIFSLGAEEFLVARDTSSIYPRVVEELPNLGFAGALNAEAMLEFQPTLVIATPMAGPEGVLEQLRQAGVEVLVLDELNGLDAPQIKIRIIGEAIGLPQLAEALAQDVEKRLATVMDAASGNKPLRVLHLYFRRGGLQLVSGEGNKAQTIIEAAGGVDAAAEAGIVGWQPLTPEALVASDPDVYLVMDRGIGVIGGIEGMMQIPGVALTKAGRNMRIISMPDLYLLGFGPRLPEAISDLSQYINEVQDQVLSE